MRAERLAELVINRRRRGSPVAVGPVEPCPDCGLPTQKVYLKATIEEGERRRFYFTYDAGPLSRVHACKAKGPYAD